MTLGIQICIGHFSTMSFKVTQVMLNEVPSHVGYTFIESSTVCREPADPKAASAFGIAEKVLLPFLRLNVNCLLSTVTQKTTASYRCHLESASVTASRGASK